MQILAAFGFSEAACEPFLSQGHHLVQICQSYMNDAILAGRGQAAAVGAVVQVQHRAIVWRQG